MNIVREQIWMYGAVCGAYHTLRYKLPGENTMDCADACRKYGLKKAVMDVCVKGPVYPFDAESEKLAFLDELVWTIFPSGSVVRNDMNYYDRDEIIRQIQKYPNVKGVFVDDFQYRRRSHYTPEMMAAMKQKVQASSPRPITLWQVLYATDILTERITPHHALDYGAYVDTVSFWNWHPFHIKVLRENLAYMASQWPGKKYNLGIYLWDFSKGAPIDDDLMQLQLDTSLALMHEGMLDGLTICASCIMGIDLRAEELFAKWLDKHGDEELAPRSQTTLQTVIGDNERL
ncbi:MAG: hypothetical protein IKR81_16485 [Victivallales bacterium]|nr:hypothetical protein [Victivallales bacterium]